MTAPMKLLLIDDEELLVEYLMRSLEQDSHCVDYATDGKSGLKKAICNMYDVIILDVVMPKMSGYQVVSDLRQQGIKTPVLMLSSNDQEDSKVTALDSGADDYITKPFGYNELSARLRALQRRSQNTLPEPVEFSGMTYDPNARTLTKNQATIPLRPKEMAVLGCLLESHGQAVSRPHLLHRVWGVSLKNSSTRLEVCIKSLRGKLDDTPSNSESIIQSVRGFGYVIHD